MKAGTQVSLDEYLETVYRPDCDYVDGEVVERNVGDYDHSLWQAALIGYLQRHYSQFQVMPELRVHVAATRYRIPDLAVLLPGHPRERYLTTPPFLCIEILSDRDTLDNIQDRIDDYLAMGVRFVWVVSPRSRRGWVYAQGSIVEAKDGVLRTEEPEITVALKDVVD